MSIHTGASARPFVYKNLEIYGDLTSEQKAFLSDDCLDFFIKLQQKFGPRRLEVLELRKQREQKIKSGTPLGFLAETQKIRESQWSVGPAPADLQDRRVEITGPTDAKMLINALNSGAKVFMADLEDSLSPTWQNIISGQMNLFKAVRRSLEFGTPETKIYKLNPNLATLVVRPRGWHLRESHVLLDGNIVSASLFDFAIYFYKNAKELLERGSGPYFYLPKMESHLEARLWNDVFIFAQDQLKIPQGTIRATVLIETILAAFEMEEILFELKEHAAGLNAGRWDYLFSMIKKLGSQVDFSFPDRAELTMNLPYMKAYCELLVQTCHKRGAHAIGGMAAFIPSRKDAEINAKAFTKVTEDKTREAQQGFDGTWVAHPDLVAVAQKVFDEYLKEKPNQKEKIPQTQVLSSSLLPIEIAGTKITRAGVINNISVALQYITHWLKGTGAVAIYNLMEDAATAEISRAELWQWIQRKAKTAEGDIIDSLYFKKLLNDEVLRLEQSESLGSDLQRAQQILENLVLNSVFTEFLTLPAYDVLNQLTTHKECKMTLGEWSHQTAESLTKAWSTDSRWRGVIRPYKAEEVLSLRPSVHVRHTLAERGAHKLWSLVNGDQHIATMGAMTGAQATQMVRGGLKALYLSGWQVAADANLSSQTYPDQSLYPANSVPAVVKRINNALMRADQIERSEGGSSRDWYAPIVADAEAGFGGPLHAFELMKSMIEAGASGVHFEDQLAAEKKCGHLGGKVLLPTSQFVKTLTAARLACDVMDVPTIIIARTDALGANLMTSDIDPYDRPFLTGERTPEGYFRVKGGIEAAIARGLAYAPYADLLWFETSKPDMAEAKAFAEAIHKKYPGKLLAYNCSPSFNWKKNLNDAEIAKFQKELGSMGYKFQFITLAGWHLLNLHSYELAHAYAQNGMTAYVELQEQEFAREKDGYTATRHQREVGTGYFDSVLMTITGGQTSTAALAHSTEAEQFHEGAH